MILELLDELESAVLLVKHCDKTQESQKAKMNFIVNLVTLLEVFSRRTLYKTFDDSVLEGSFSYNTILPLAYGDVAKSKMLHQLISMRNTFVHEGKSTVIHENQITAYYLLIKSIISGDNRELICNRIQKGF